ncbi:uncharacterized protein [Coffea arabica]|uniref:Reverse transcriptase zinc-binding domain-containing protein n=1 Tax=Coffea arabica TaxID=13443 RepID=A0ABM4V3M3_COFAR
MEAIRKIGNGKSTRIWEDNWIPDSPNGKPSVAKPQGCQLRMVSDLISNHSWNRVLILKTFYSQDAEQILRIPISVIGKEDSFYWKHSQHGQYTVQSGYKVWMKEKNQMDYMTRKEAGTSYEGNISCGEREETIEHMMLQCKKAKEIWKMAPVQWEGLEHLTGCFTKWWLVILDAQKSRREVDQVNVTINILWQIWKARNEREFNQKEREPHKIIEKALKEWREFEEVNKGMEPRMITQETEVHQWSDQH